MTYHRTNTLSPLRATKRQYNPWLNECKKNKKKPHGIKENRRKRECL